MNSTNETPSSAFDPGFSRLIDAISEQIANLISMVIAVITKKMETADAIFYLGALNEEPTALYFLIITSDTEQRKSESLNSMVEESCRAISKVVVFVHNARNVRGAVKGSNHFFSNILLNKPLVYLSGRYILPKPSGLNYPLFLQKAAKVWALWYGMAIDHIAGASFFLERGNNRLALFCLHQATECILKAINRAITGYRIEVHNLSRLLLISTLYTGKLTEVFPTNDEEERSAFNLLKDAYTDSRYKDNFEPDHAQVSALYGHVVRLQVQADKLYLAHISAMDNAI